MTKSINRRDFFQISGGIAVIAATAAVMPGALAATNNSRSLNVDASKRIHVTHEYGRLTEVIMGNCPAQDDLIPVWQDGADHNMASWMKPETVKTLKENAGKTWAESFDSNTMNILKKEVEDFANLLIANGVKVHRLPRLAAKDRDLFNAGIDQIYPRDMWCTVGNTAIVSSLRMDFKRKQQFAAGFLYNDLMNQGEGLYVSAPQAAGNVFTDNVEAQKIAEKNNILLDGGDFLVRGKDIFCGVGHGSNLNGIKFVQTLLGDGYTVHPIIMDDQALHLDCAMSLLSPNLGLLCREWIKSELPAELNHMTWIDVTPEEAAWLGSNGLPLDAETVIMDPRHKRIIAEIKKHGHKVIECNYSVPSMLGGSLRCSTQPIRREPV